MATRIHTKAFVEGGASSAGAGVGAVGAAGAAGAAFTGSASGSRMPWMMRVYSPGPESTSGSAGAGGGTTGGGGDPGGAYNRSE